MIAFMKLHTWRTISKGKELVVRVGITFCVGALVAVLGFQTMVWGQDPELSPCSKAYSEWQQAFGALAQEMESLSNLKRESLAPTIASELNSRGKASSIAQVVHGVTGRHNRAVAELGEECVRLADSEKIAFEQWRRCRSSEPRGRDDHSAAGAMRERSQRLVELQDLLLDDAFLQYRKESPNPPSAYSRGQDSNPERRIGSGPYDPNYGMQ
jgi:hypothetical protein